MAGAVAVKQGAKKAPNIAPVSLRGPKLTNVPLKTKMDIIRRDMRARKHQNWKARLEWRAAFAAWQNREKVCLLSR